MELLRRWFVESKGTLNVSDNFITILMSSLSPSILPSPFPCLPHYRPPSPSLSSQQTFLWHQDQVVVPWLEQQVTSPSSSIRENTECIRNEYILRQLHRYIYNYIIMTSYIMMSSII